MYDARETFSESLLLSFGASAPAVAERPHKPRQAAIMGEKVEGDERLADDDIALMLRVKEGDEDALEQLIERWKNPLINYFYRSIGSRADAEDMAQVTFIKLHGAAERYEPKAKFSTYLFHIGRRVLLNEYRRRGRKPLNLYAPEELPQPAAADPELSLLELEEIFQRALTQMPENHRTAILLLRQQELSYAEIAEIMGTSESLIKTWIYRARQVLKAELTKHL